MVSKEYKDIMYVVYVYLRGVFLLVRVLVGGLDGEILLRDL